MKIVHNDKICISCGACFAICSRKNFNYNENNRVQLVYNASNNCLLCGHCFAVCPKSGALEFGSNILIEQRDVFASPSPEIIYNFLSSRRSIRRFSEKIPTKQQIEILIDAGRYAPSGHNSQDFHFIVVLGHNKVKTIGEIGLEFYDSIIKKLDTNIGSLLIRIFAGEKKFGILKKMEHRLRQHLLIYKETGSIEMVWDAPCLILIHGPDRQDSLMNSAFAGYNTILQAHSMGLGTCILGLLREGLTHARAKLEGIDLKIPFDHKIHMILCLGTPLSSSKFVKIPPRESPKIKYIEDP